MNQYPTCKHCSRLGTCGEHYERKPSDPRAAEISLRLAKGKATISDWKWLATGKIEK